MMENRTTARAFGRPGYLGALLALIGAAALLAGCRSETTPSASRAPIVAVAELEPTEGYDVRATVRFTEVDDGVRIEAEAENLVSGLHGFHIHENGDCSAPDASSAGPHFNPYGAPHGSPLADRTERHAGDLGNLAAHPETGKAVYVRVDDVIELRGENSIIGRAVIIHASEDDLDPESGLTGGPRVACGVIRRQD